MNPTILVTGATGKQGGAVVRHLLNRGFSVRALTRNASSPAAAKLLALGAEVVQGDLENRDSLVMAAQGCTGVFSVQNFWEKGVGAAGEIRQAKNLIAAAEEVRIQHFVQASIAGNRSHCEATHVKSKWEIEDLIRASSLPAYTFVCTVMFMENFKDSLGRNFFVPMLRGHLPEDFQLYLTAADDIGSAVATVFANPERYKNVSVNIASDVVRVGEIRTIMKEKTGRQPAGFKIPAWLGKRLIPDFTRQMTWNKAGSWTFPLDETRQLVPELTSFRTFFDQQSQQL